ncbi:hypothetical protein V2J09_002054 [Rumex salicifolius]
MAATLSSSSNGVKFQIEMLARSMRVALLMAVLLLLCASGSCYAADFSSSSYGFTIHHRFSDAVRTIFPAAGDEVLPERGTVHYFAAMAERDRIHGRRLAAAGTYSSPLTFIAGNTTINFASLGFLYYAQVSVGTPRLDFLVALDTGSDLFWLPCDCQSCAIIQTKSGVIPFNNYGLNTSSTGKEVACSSSFCAQTASCALRSQCPYETIYLSSNTSTSGYLVEDVLHLTTDTNPSKPIDANITFGCGQRQTGTFLTGGAPNGLFGLGMGDISVPSVLASKNITANSFSMCFNRNGVGRISFGDKGTYDQAETPFIIKQSHPRYDISITQISVGQNSSNVDMDAIFDTGTSFTIFTDPCYSIITEAFNSQVKDTRVAISNVPFEFCYDTSGELDTPSINLTMKGRANYNIISPFLIVNTNQSRCSYCVGIIKDDSVNIIGENFMSGYRVVFDREKMVLGWKESNCNYTLETTSLPISPQNSPMSPQISPTTSPYSLPTIPSTLNPEATPASPGSSKNAAATSTAIKHWALTLFWAYYHQLEELEPLTRQKPTRRRPRLKLTTFNPIHKCSSSFGQIIDTIVSNPSSRVRTSNSTPHCHLDTVALGRFEVLQWKNNGCILTRDDCLIWQTSNVLPIFITFLEYLRPEWNTRWNPHKTILILKFINHKIFNDSKQNLENSEVKEQIRDKPLVIHKSETIAVTDFRNKPQSEPVVIGERSSKGLPQKPYTTSHRKDRRRVLWRREAIDSGVVEIVVAAGEARGTLSGKEDGLRRGRTEDLQDEQTERRRRISTLVLRIFEMIDKMSVGRVLHLEVAIAIGREEREGTAGRTCVKSNVRNL